MKPILCLLILMPVFLSGQSRIGEWTTHVSYNPIIRVTETSESIVAATANGILFTDKKGSQLVTKTKADGLSEVGITAIAFASEPNLLLVGYETGNLDLLKNERVINFPDLARKSGIADKTILNIVCEGNFAYLCCAFGIVKIDLLKIEVAETWYLGSGSDLKMVYGLTTYKNNWYAATNHGIFKAEKQNTNLQDFRNWKIQTSLPQSDSKFSSFAQSEGMLFTHDITSDKLFAWNGINWQQKYPEIKKIRSINAASSGIIILTENEIWLANQSGNSRIDRYHSGFETQAIDPRDALKDSNGTLWIGDYNFGLTRQSGNNFQHMLPNSPCSDKVIALKAGPEAIFAATFTRAPDGTQDASLSIFQTGIWQNFTSTDDPGLKSIRPFTSFAFDQDHPDEYWASSAGSGLLHFQKDRVSSRYAELNSALGALGGSCIVSGIATDNQNNLWYANPTGKVRLGSRSANGTFVSLPYAGMDFSSSPTGEIIVSNSNIHWVVLPDEGLFAFKIKNTTENIADDQYRKVAVKSRFSNGTSTLISPFSDISAIVEDLNHELWVGTGTGIVVYNDPDKVFDNSEFYGVQPSIDDGEGLFKPILEKERITSIAVDGGNRKWIGSAYSGAFLFTQDGDHLLHHFDSKNSPLLSDKILSIAIDSKSGEVFFATDRGLISYKSDATTGESDLKKAYVWPNPVRETFEGNVTIDGLAEGTDIRITDVSGNLVFKSSSVGGRAIWNIKNSRGARVSTGVYLILCNSPSLKTTKIIKLLVIH